MSDEQTPQERFNELSDRPEGAEDEAGEGSREGMCPATNSNDDPCGNEAGHGVAGADEGPCKYHGGATPTKDENEDVGAPEGNSNGEGDGAPERNGNAITHGATADPWNLYEHMPGGAQNWCEAYADAYADHLGFGDTDPRRDQLLQAGLHQYQSRSGEGHIFADGLSEEVTVSVTEYGEVVQDEEHHLEGVVIERSREARQILKDLGALDSPGQRLADSNETLASAIKEVAND